MNVDLFYRIKSICTLIALLWCIELVNHFLGHRLNVFGLLPRELSQLWGIFTSPFLHGNIMHLAANTPPLFFLGVLAMGFGDKRFWLASGLIITLGGLGVWCFGRASIHVGASGWIFGLFGFLLATAWWERSLYAIVLATIAIVLYGGLIWGIVPTKPYISWEGHLFGLLAGLLSGTVLHQKPGHPSPPG